VIHSIPAHHQIANVQIGAKGACNTGVYQMGYAVNIAKDLGAHRGIDLAHAALHHHGINALQPAGIVFRPGVLGGGNICHLFFEQRNFHIHCADNSQFHSKSSLFGVD